MKRKGVWWLLEVNHDLNKEHVSTSLEEEAEVAVSVFLPSERTYLATTPQLTPEIVEELLSKGKGNGRGKGKGWEGKGRWKGRKEECKTLLFIP